MNLPDFKIRQAISAMLRNTLLFSFAVHVIGSSPDIYPRCCSNIESSVGEYSDIHKVEDMKYPGRSFGCFSGGQIAKVPIQQGQRPRRCHEAGIYENGVLQVGSLKKDDCCYDNSGDQIN